MFCFVFSLPSFFLSLTSYLKVINVHHWIGKESTPDKYGACAIRAIELNVRLGGQCRIYREVEGEESDLFVSYFEDDLEYLFGGSETAFRKVEEMIWEPRLYQICRLVDRQDPHKENEFYVQKVEMVGDILTHDDVYVLDMVSYYYYYYSIQIVIRIIIIF